MPYLRLRNRKRVQSLTQQPGFQQWINWIIQPYCIQTTVQGQSESLTLRIWQNMKNLSNCYFWMSIKGVVNYVIPKPFQNNLVFAFNFQNLCACVIRIINWVVNKPERLRSFSHLNCFALKISQAPPPPLFFILIIQTTNIYNCYSNRQLLMFTIRQLTKTTTLH